MGGREEGEDGQIEELKEVQAKIKVCKLERGGGMG